LRRAERRAIRDRARRRPRNHGRRLVHRQRYVRGCSCVISSVGRREGNVQRLTARGKNSPRTRRIGKCAGHIGCRIKLRRTERRAIRDWRRSSPRNNWRRLVHRQSNARRRGRVIGGIGRIESNVQRLTSRSKNSPRTRRIDKCASHVGRRVKLRRAERRAIRDRARRRPRNNWRRLVHRQCYVRGCSCVISSVGRREGNAQRLTARGKNSPRTRRIDKCAGHVGRRVKLRRAERRAIRDRARRRPRNHGRRLVHRQRYVRGCSCVISSVGRREGNVQRLTARGKNSPRTRRIGKCAGHIGCRIKLRRTERRAIRDWRRSSPRNNWRRLVHRQSNARRRGRVIGGIGRIESNVQRLTSRSKNSPRTRRIGKCAGHIGCRIKLRRTERRAIGNRARRGPRNHGRRFVHRQNNTRRRGRVIGGVGRRESDVQRLTALGKNRAGRRRVSKCARHVGRGIKLRRAKRRAIRNRRGRGPGDDGRGLVHRQRYTACSVRVIGGIGRRESNVQRLTSRGKNRAGRWRIGKCACHIGRRIKLHRAKRRAIRNWRGRGPGDDRRLLNNRWQQRDCNGSCFGVIGLAGGSHGHRLPRGN